MATTAGKTSVDYRRRYLGGAAGDFRLTTLSGSLLLVLLAVEGATIPFIRPLLSMHVFVGMLLLGPVALKLGSTGYRSSAITPARPNTSSSGRLRRFSVSGWLRSSCSRP